MSTILVTGGAGFLGSNLCRFLLKNVVGVQIICLDNLASGNLRNVTDLRSRPDFVFVKHDIVEPFKIDKKIDFIFNLACLASPVDYQKFPIKTLLTSSDGVKNMLDLAVVNKAKILHTSTSEVYGNPKEHPQKETYWGNVNPIGPRSCYDEGKRFAESLIVNYHQKYGLDTKIVRIFNTYGPAMRPNDGRGIANFVMQALKGQDLTVYGDGSQTRSFCYVSDLIEGLFKMSKSTESGPINLGNPTEFTIKELAEKIISKIPTKSKITYMALPQDDPLRRKPDITLAKTKLGWEPKVNLDDGLDLTIEYFRQIS